MNLYSILLFIAAIIPPIIIMYIVYNVDAEREPLKLILSLFAVGILSGSITILSSYLIQYYFPQLEQLNNQNLYNLFIYTFLKIGIIEEFSKWFFSFSLCWKNRAFDQKYDAIVYTVATSLGFAILENVMYVMTGTFKQAFLRGIYSVPGHAIFAIISGYYIGKAKYDYEKGERTKWKFYKRLSLLLPSIYHTAFDFLLFANIDLYTKIFIGFVGFLYINGIIKIILAYKDKSVV